MKPIYALLIAVVVGAAGFFGGMQYQKMQANAQFGAGFNGRFQSGQGQFFGRNGMGGRNGGARVVGTILNMDSNALTVKLPDGSTRIVVLSKSTTVSKSTEGTVSDLKVGDSVAVFGSTNSDGSMTAQNVQTGQFRMQGQGAATPPASSQSGSPGQ